MTARPDGGREDDRRTDDRGSSENDDEAETAEQVLTVVSALLTVAVVAYVGLHIVAEPRPPYEPEADVVETRTLPNGAVAVTVELQNPYDRGLARATVESSCATPAPSVSPSMVPAESTVRGTLVCPPGTETPEVYVSEWVKE